MQRLEMTAPFDECFPHWSMVGQPQRAGWSIAWLDLSTAPAGAVLDGFADDE
jgi:hypothetical protein